MTNGHKKTAVRRLPAVGIPDANPVRCCFSDARRILRHADSCNRHHLERPSKGLVVACGHEASKVTLTTCHQNTPKIKVPRTYCAKFKPAVELYVQYTPFESIVMMGDAVSLEMWKKSRSG